MKPLNSVLSNLKLRGSWGNIGNQSITPYAYIPGMDAEQAYWTVSGIKVTTLKPAALVSNSFTWEKVTTIDVGWCSTGIVEILRVCLLRALNFRVY